MSLRANSSAAPLIVAVAAFWLVTGCSPTAPSSSRTTSSTSISANPVPVQLSGVVTDDDGAPVSGVTVFVKSWDGSEVTTPTDASGRYSITFNGFLTPGRDLSAPVHTEKTGYENSVYGSSPIGCVLRDPATNACRPGQSTFVQDLRIYRIRFLPVGQSTTIDVKREDPECSLSDEPFFCRAVRITGPPGAMVAVQASTNPSNPVARLALDPTSTTCCSLAVTANVPTTGELPVYLGSLWYGPATTFTLTSAFLP